MQETTLKKILIQVQKEFCEECSLAIMRFMQNMEGIESVTAEGGWVSITFDESRVIEERVEQIARENIEKLGTGFIRNRGDFLFRLEGELAAWPVPGCCISQYAARDVDILRTRLKSEYPVSGLLHNFFKKAEYNKKVKKIMILSLTGLLMAGYFMLSGDADRNTEAAGKKMEKAVFAGGCFWCIEPPFEKLEGVKEVISGYTGGQKDNPTYEEVSAGTTGHMEAVEVIYDPSRVSYEKLLEVFWRQIDPTDPGGQFVDRGTSYQSAIFYRSEEQKRLAEESKDKLGKSGIFHKPIVTEVRPALRFYTAEEYHQDYYKKNPVRYKFYRFNSGRDQYLKKVWEGRTEMKDTAREKKKYSKPSKEELKKRLTPLQYKVTQENGTERAYDNEYHNNKREGIYVDIVSGEPLFSSLDKYDSGTGWPSFSKPLEPANIVEREDKSWFSTRTEVRSKHGDSHLGHVFTDGPKPTGLRYCMNSAALRFIPKEDLEKEGYGEYKQLFKK